MYMIGSSARMLMSGSNSHDGSRQRSTTKNEDDINSERLHTPFTPDSLLFLRKQLRPLTKEECQVLVMGGALSIGGQATGARPPTMSETKQLASSVSGYVFLAAFMSVLCNMPAAGSARP